MTGTREILRRRRFCVDDVVKMVAAGVFAEDERFELIDGELVEMPTPGPRHAARVDRLTQLLVERCQRRCIVRVQNPLVLDPHNSFLPDMALLRPRADWYDGRHPDPGDTLLALEVADHSLWRDRRVKLPIYARLRVPRVWILDLRASCVHAYDDLRRGRYGTEQRCQGDDRLAIPNDGEVTAAEILGA